MSGSGNRPPYAAAASSGTVGLMRRLLLPVVLLSSFLLSGAPRAQTGSIPLIDFTTKPNYIPNTTIVLTFDDGPDLVNTPKVLDTLKANGVKASFFINTHNVVNVDTDAAAKNLVKRIVAEGHELANHTVAHLHLPQQSDAKIESELAGVEKTVADIFGPEGPKLTLFRAPYGEPYTDGSGAAFTKVATIGAKHAVHIGWAIDTNDWACPTGNAQCVYDNFTKLVKTPGTGAYGVVLMHSIHPQSAGALARIIDYAKMNGFVFKQVEDVVRARYGKSSAEIFGVKPGTGGQGGTTGGTGGATGSDAGSGGSSGQGGTTGGGGAPAIEDAGAGGSAGGSAGGGTGGSGPTQKPDAGSKATGGSSGGAPGTGGEEETGGSSGGSARAPSGGCSYGGRNPAALWVISLAAAGLFVIRRRRRS